MPPVLPFPRKSSASHSDHTIQPRKVQFDWATTPLDWIPNQPFASHFINEINLILPAGELWFCRLYNQVLPLVTDPKLKQDVQAFIRQEAMHSRAHSSACAEYLNAHGISTERNLAVMDFLFERIFADAPLGIKLPKILDRQWMLFRLGIIAAVEHMTCVLGKYALSNTEWEKRGADATLLDLIRWHGAEEIEHRSVAFDLYEHLGGSYLSRYYLSALSFVAVFGIWADGAAHLMRQDPRLKPQRPSVWRPWLWKQWVANAKQGLLPDPAWLFLSELPYLSPWYDPRNAASTEQALAYLAQSPAARAVNG